MPFAGPTLFTGAQKQELFATFDFAALRAEAQQVESAAAGTNSPVVFSHNDLLSGGLGSLGGPRCRLRLRTTSCVVLHCNSQAVLL